MQEIFKNKMTNPNFENVTDVAAQEVLDHKNQLHLIDVRQPEEYTGELGHIANTKLIVLNTIPEQLNSIPKDKHVVFVCRSGGRSAQACAYALSQGYTNVYNMMGGMLMWNQLQFPTEK
jgi:rhodanese-related sulfurtransferase